MDEIETKRDESRQNEQLHRKITSNILLPTIAVISFVSGVLITIIVTNAIHRKETNLTSVQKIPSQQAVKHYSFDELTKKGLYLNRVQKISLQYSPEWELESKEIDRNGSVLLTFSLTNPENKDYTETSYVSLYLEHEYGKGFADTITALHKQTESFSKEEKQLGLLKGQAASGLEKTGMKRFMYDFLSKKDGKSYYALLVSEQNRKEQDQRDVEKMLSSLTVNNPMTLSLPPSVSDNFILATKLKQPVVPELYTLIFEKQRQHSLTYEYVNEDVKSGAGGSDITVSLYKEGMPKEVSTKRTPVTFDNEVDAIRQTFGKEGLASEMREGELTLRAHPEHFFERERTSTKFNYDTQESEDISEFASYLVFSYGEYVGVIQSRYSANLRAEDLQKIVSSIIE